MPIPNTEIAVRLQGRRGSVRNHACNSQVIEVVVDRHGRPVEVIESPRPNPDQRARTTSSFS